MEELKKFLDKNYGGSAGYSWDENGVKTDGGHGYYNYGSRDYYDNLGKVLKEIYEKLN